MCAILEAAKLQGKETITRKAWIHRENQTTHLWELSGRGVILLRYVKNEGFKQPVKLDEPLEVIVDRFRQKRGNSVVAAQAI